MNLQLLQMLWDAGYEFDSIGWCDDMGYKNNQFFSVDTYKEILKPYHQKAVQWAHSHGVNTHLHSCGDIRPFIPELINIGVDALNPLEVKAGIDPLEIKNKFGSKLVLHGGVNALLFDDFGSLYQTVNKILPQLKQDGGYIFASDHSIPSSISFEDFGKLIELIKRVGSYE
jgi:uroporphyrinogen decarboxylase